MPGAYAPGIFAFKNNPQPASPNVMLHCNSCRKPSNSKALVLLKYHWLRGNDTSL
jgi:hypothetical protein